MFYSTIKNISELGDTCGEDVECVGVTNSVCNANNECDCQRAYKRLVGRCVLLSAYEFDIDLF